MADSDDQNAKLLALAGYLGFFIGLPTGLLPLLMAKDELSLFHGKVATAVWFAMFGVGTILGMVISAISAATCGLGALLFPILIIPALWGWVVGLHGIVLSLNGEMTEPIGGFGLGQMLFANLQVKGDGPTSLPAPKEEAPASGAGAAPEPPVEPAAVAEPVVEEPVVEEAPPATEPAADAPPAPPPPPRPGRPPRRPPGARGPPAAPPPPRPAGGRCAPASPPRGRACAASASPGARCHRRPAPSPVERGGSPTPAASGPRDSGGRRHRRPTAPAQGLVS